MLSIQVQPKARLSEAAHLLLWQQQDSLGHTSSHTFRASTNSSGHSAFFH